MFITTNIRVWRSHSSIVHLCIILYLHLTFINIKTILVSSTTEPFTSFIGRPKTTNNPTSHGNNNGNHLDRPYISLRIRSEILDSQHTKDLIYSLFGC
ncbi:hypothetical protein BLOT_013530 [Blomia tropicalis]|nr:hypothetical protein BLOT_013530 [Blomia tropicalis]